MDSALAALNIVQVQQYLASYKHELMEKKQYAT
jgi:hypothetical protein